MRNDSASSKGVVRRVANDIGRREPRKDCLNTTGSGWVSHWRQSWHNGFETQPTVLFAPRRAGRVVRDDVSRLPRRAGHSVSGTA